MCALCACVGPMIAFNHIYNLLSISPSSPDPHAVGGGPSICQHALPLALQSISFCSLGLHQ